MPCIRGNLSTANYVSVMCMLCRSESVRMTALQMLYANIISATDSIHVCKEQLAFMVKSSHNLMIKLTDSTRVTGSTGKTSS